LSAKSLNIDFIRNLIKDTYSLWRASEKFISFSETLTTTFHNKDLCELLAKEHYKRMLLGGLKEDLSVASNALLRFYKVVYGIDYDIDELIARLKAGMKLDRACEGIKVKVESTEIIEEVKSLEIALKEVLMEPKVKEIEDFSSRLTKSSIEIRTELDGVKLFEELVDSLLTLSPNYNENVLKLISLRRLPWFYVAEAYPSLASNKELLKHISGVLDWGELYIPQVSDEEVKRKYTVMGYLPQGLGEKLISTVIESLKVLAMIHHMTRAETFFTGPLSSFTKIEHEVGKYVERCIKVLKETYEERKPPVYGDLYGRYTGYTGKYPEHFFFAIKNRTNYWRISYPPLGKGCKALKIKVEGLKADRSTLPEILHYIAPQLYLGIATIEKGASENELEIIYYDISQY